LAFRCGPITVSASTDHPEPEQRTARPGERRRAIARRALLLLGWIIALTLALASGAWLFSGAGWRIDLIANLTAQVMLVAIVIAAGFALLRWWRHEIPIAVALSLCAFGLASDRAERADAGRAGGGDPVRVLAYNVYASDRIGAAAARIVEATDADVLVVIEPTSDVVRLLRDSESFRERYPHRSPGRPITARPTVISRWPIESLRLRYGAVQTGSPSPGMSPTGVIVRRPGGAFIVIATHPPSPRSEEAWANGNEGIRRLAGMVNGLAQEHGLPVLVGGDFNSTPTGWRSRWLSSEAGLLRCKPWTVLDGTWPNSMPWPGRLAIDDVFVTPGVRVVRWDSLAGTDEGDHSPVVVDLLIPIRPEAADTAPPDQTDQSMPQ